MKKLRLKMGKPCPRSHSESRGKLGLGKWDEQKMQMMSYVSIIIVIIGLYVLVKTHRIVI